MALTMPTHFLIRLNMNEASSAQSQCTLLPVHAQPAAQRRAHVRNVGRATVFDFQGAI